mgnify:CR=1 FL=1
MLHFIQFINDDVNNERKEIKIKSDFKRKKGLTEVLVVGKVFGWILAGGSWECKFAVFNDKAIIKMLDTIIVKSINQSITLIYI